MNEMTPLKLTKYLRNFQGMLLKQQFMSMLQLSGNSDSYLSH